jgi:hypothetical protein
MICPRDLGTAVEPEGAVSGRPHDDATSSKDTPVPVSCLTKRGLAQYLGVSVRSLDRGCAMKLLPTPDLVVGRSPRWAPETIAKWLRTRPRLPGRSRRGTHA